MSKKTFRVGIIGTGFGASVHAPMMQNHPGFEVAAIASVSRGRLEEIRQETGIERVYDDWRKMLEEEQLDVVAVTSNPFYHHEMTRAAFEKGLHVYCEKPMAMNASQTQEMIDARDQAGRLGLINFEFRFRPARLKVRELVQSGQLGRILHVSFRGIHRGYLSSTTRRRHWLGQKEMGGGMLGALGSHMFDSMMWWLDSPVAEVGGQLAIHVPEMTDEAGVKEIRTADDSFQAFGTFANGATFAAEYVNSSKNLQRTTVEIHGTGGTLVMTDDRRIELALGDEPLQEIELPAMLEQPDHMPQTTASYYGAFYPMLDQVYETLLQGTPTELVPTFENGHLVQHVLDAVYRSAETGTRIRL